MKLLKKNRGRKGFTLGELLIVVAVIGVLSAVAAPVLFGKLEKAREAHDIYTMRQAATAAVELYYEGITDAASAAKFGLKWNAADAEGTNAYGVYDPGSGRFLPLSSQDTKGMSYGKGTTFNGGTAFVLGNPNGAYSAKEDYTKAVVMVAIYPKSATPHADIYWKTSDRKYVGGNNNGRANDPKYSIRIMLS